MRSTKSIYIIGLLFIGLIGGLLNWYMPVISSGSVITLSSPLPSPKPRATVYGLSVPPPAPTGHPITTPSQFNSISYGPHSPVPTPTPIPDFVPPQTIVQIQGEQNDAQWYRSPISVTFTITDNFGAGYTEYQLNDDPNWIGRAYYYPPVVIADEGVYTLTYRSIDIVHNTEAPQTTQLRIDRTPPQAAAPEVDGNQLLNGWYNTPVKVTFTGSDALSGLASFEQQATNTAWVASPEVTTFATTGQQIVTWRAVDNAGNVSAAQQTTLQLDLTPPTTTYSLDALPVNSWYTRPVTVTLSAVDLGAGVFQTQSRLNNAGGWQIYGGPFPVTGEGVQTLVYQSTDRALNIESSHTLTLPIDLAAPTLEVTVNNGDPVNGWHNNSITVTAQASDAQAGLASVEYQLDNAGWQPYTTALPITTGVLHTVQFQATDGVGHRTTTQIFALGVDTQPPTTTVHLSESPNPAGWFKQPVTVTLTATDTQTGVWQTQYRLSDESQWRIYSGPFAVSQEGKPTVEYYATDLALNAEAVRSFILPIDQSAPEIQAEINGGKSINGWYSAVVTVVAHSKDEVSGAASVQYELDGAGWQPYTTPVIVQPGAAHQLHFRAIDQAGQTATTALLAVGVDARPPTTALVLNPPSNAANWFNQPVTVTLVATDSETGVFQTQYHWHDQLSPTVYQQPFRLAHEGNHTITWFSVDRALNQEQPHTQPFHLDLTPPLITYTVTGQSVAPGWYQTAATLHITATDALAGVAQVEYTLDGGGWQPYTTPLTVASGGQHTVQLRARDVAGNLNAIDAVPFDIDTIAPQSTIWLAGGRAPNGWYVTPVTVTLTTTDSGAGVADGKWRLDGGLWQAYTGPFVVHNERVNLLEYAALDKAANQEPQKFMVFSLDLQNSASQAAVLQGTSGNNRWFVSPVALTLQGQDAESGLTGVEYQVPPHAWQTYTTPVELTTEGMHTVTYRALDASGRLEATHTLTVPIDLTPPQIQTKLPAELAYGNLALTGLYTVTDGVSQVITLTVLLNGQPYQPTQPLRLGENTLEIMAVNGAGLASKRAQTITVTGGRTYLPIIKAK